MVAPRFPHQSYQDAKTTVAGERVRSSPVRRPHIIDIIVIIHRRVIETVDETEAMEYPMHGYRRPFPSAPGMN